MPAFCCGPGISSRMQVYALPEDCREVTELEVPWKQSSRYAQAKSEADRGSSNFRSMEDIESVEDLSQVRVGETID